MNKHRVGLHAALTAAALIFAIGHSQARFVQADPVGYADDMDMYTYVQDDPANNTDPTGQTCDGVGPCDTTNVSKGSVILVDKAAEAAANHPGETMQLVGSAISMVPAGPAKVVGGAVSGAGTIVKSVDGEATIAPPQAVAPTGRQPGPTIDRATGREVGRIVGDSKGNNMIEPVGGTTVQGPKPSETHTTYPNGSNYQRLNPQGHKGIPTGHGHGHLEGTAPFTKGQGQSIDPLGNVVPRDSDAAHWSIYP